MRILKYPFVNKIGKWPKKVIHLMADILWEQNGIEKFREPPRYIELALAGFVF